MPRRSYTRLTAEEYLLNVSKSLSATNYEVRKLKPLIEANHGSDCNIALYAMPTVPLPHQSFDVFLHAVGNYVPDVIFLQMEPMPYLVR